MSKRFVHPALFGLLGFVFLIFLIWQLSVPAFAQTKPQVDLTGKNVLVLHALEGSAPVFVDTDRGLLTTLESGGVPRLNQFFETLDLRRNPGFEHRRLLADQMRVRYGRRKLDMIITMYPEALEFVLKDGRNIFPNVPILALYLPPGMELPKTDRRIIGHATSYDIIGTFEIALKLVPGAKRVYIVSGAHPVDRGREDQARRDLKTWEGRLEFRYLSRMSFEDILATISSTPPNTIILLLTFGQDITGRGYTAQHMTQRLSQVSTAPIFGLLNVGLGHGIAGGSLIGFEHIGTKAGEMVLDILRGAKAAENIPAVLDVSPVPMFDWRQLRRWNLSEAALPMGSIVINKELTLWDLRYYIIGGLVFCLVETALIIILIAQRRRKKVAEEGLLRKTEELDQFFNVSLDLLCIANTDGYFLRLNPAWERILGYSREELMSRRFVDFVHPEDLDKTLEAVSTLASQQKVFFFENRYRCKDGTYRWLQWSSVPSGNLIYAAARDVTEHKRADEALRESEARLRDITFSMGDWVWEVDEKGVYTYSSQKGFDLLGRSREDVIGKTPFDFMPPDEAKRASAIFSEIVANKAPIKDLEKWNIRKNGERICLVTNGVPMLDEEGNLKGYRGVDKDITEHKRVGAEIARARAELLRVERSSRLSELTASLAHELNQPLAAILSNAQAALTFLKSDKPDLNEFQEIMRDIISDDQRAGNVIRSLRSMMKREEGEKKPTILNDVLNDIIQIYHSEAIFRNVRIETELDGTLPSVFGDKGQLQQVLLNIIMNGAEAMSETPPEQRKLILRTQVKDDRIRVTIRDFGSGIDEENLERIFQPFFTTKRTGLGMGLALCRTIVEAHEGRIWAESNSDGGTTFFIQLPIGESGDERVTSNQ